MKLKSPWWSDMGRNARKMLVIVALICLASSTATLSELATAPSGVFGHWGLDWVLFLTVVADALFIYGWTSSFRSRLVWWCALVVIGVSCVLSFRVATLLWPCWSSPYSVVRVSSPFIQCVKGLLVMSFVALVALPRNDLLHRLFHRGGPRQARRRFIFGLLAVVLFANPYALTLRPVASRPQLSLAGGVYARPVACDITGNRVVCTTNGADPRTNVCPFARPSRMQIAHTTVLRCLATRFGYRPSETVTSTFVIRSSLPGQDIKRAKANGQPTHWKGEPADYGMDFRLAGGDWIDRDPTDSKSMRALGDALDSLPILSISCDPGDLFGDLGIYSNPLKRGKAWQRPANLEAFHHGRRLLDVSCGVRVHGHITRTRNYTRKRSIRIYFRRKYGARTIDWPFFGEYQDVRTLVLRGGGTDSWRMRRLPDIQYVRDEYARRLHQEMEGSSPQGHFAHLFLNGMYWGVYNVVERLTADYLSRRNPNDGTDWDVIKDGKVAYGNDVAWSRLRNTCLTMESETNPQRIVAFYWRLMGCDANGRRDTRLPVLLDMDDYIDYLLLNAFVVSSDWPRTNYIAYRPRSRNDIGFRFSVWDCEQSLAIDRTDSFRGAELFNSEKGVTRPLHGLMRCKHFVARFGDRVNRHFGEDGVFSDNNRFQGPSSLYFRTSGLVEDAIALEAARWGDQRKRGPIDCIGNWAKTRKYLCESFLPQRSIRMLEELQKAGLQGATSAP